jgi:midasin
LAQAPQLGSFARTGAAMRAMEAVAVAVALREPVLLVGETGTGKTTLVQQLAHQVSRCCC